MSADGEPGFPQFSSRDVVQSLERGLAVLLAFADHEEPMTITEISKLTALSRPVIRRLLITLSKAGYVRADGRHYTLTPRVLRLGYAYLSSQPLVDIAEPHMEQLTRAIQESCSLAALDGTEVVLIARVQNRRIMSINLDVGIRLPSYATSMGRMLLAGLGHDELDSHLAAAKLEPLTSHTITQESELREELARVREQGWCIVDQDLEEGVRSAAAPVRSRDGQVLAALAASVHASRVDLRAMREEYLPHILDAARAITADLASYRGVPSRRPSSISST